MKIAVLDTVIADLEREVAAHAPERGGALLGPSELAVITAYVHDPCARTSAASYESSDELRARIRERELDGARLIGVAHSHPGGLDRPSGPDVSQIGSLLETNPHLDFCIAPIITANRAGAHRPHEVPLRKGKISFYCGRRNGRGVEVSPVEVAVLPLGGDLARLAAEPGGETGKFAAVELEDSTYLGAPVTVGAEQLLVLADSSYPTSAPKILALNANRGPLELEFSWPLRIAPRERLAHAVASVLPAGSGPLRRAFGPRSGRALTANAARAAQGGWGGTYTRADPEAVRRQVAAGIRARTSGLIDKKVTGSTVLLLGAGSAASAVAEQLVRSGVGGLTIIDPDRVKFANLSRPGYDAGDIGEAKPRALARRLLQINPALEVETEDARLQELGRTRLAELIGRVDLVVAATDDPGAQLQSARLAYHLGTAGLFVGLYAGADGGELIVQVPEESACYLCATQGSRERGAERLGPGLDYGRGRLEGQIALGADITHVASAAAKLALALLLRSTRSPLGSLLDHQLDRGETFLVFSMSPEFWFFPELFAETPGHYAYGAVWLAPERSAQCPICGEQSSRTDPLKQPSRPPSPARLRSMARRRVPPPSDTPTRRRPVRSRLRSFLRKNRKQKRKE